MINYYRVEISFGSIWDMGGLPIMATAIYTEQDVTEGERASQYFVHRFDSTACAVLDSLAIR